MDARKNTRGVLRGLPSFSSHSCGGMLPIMILWRGTVPELYSTVATRDGIGGHFSPSSIFYPLWSCWPPRDVVLPSLRPCPCHEMEVRASALLRVSCCSLVGGGAGGTGGIGPAPRVRGTRSGALLPWNLGLLNGRVASPKEGPLGAASHAHGKLVRDIPSARYEV